MKAFSILLISIFPLFSFAGELPAGVSWSNASSREYYLKNTTVVQANGVCDFTTRNGVFALAKRSRSYVSEIRVGQGGQACLFVALPWKDVRHPERGQLADPNCFSMGRVEGSLPEHVGLVDENGMSKRVWDFTSPNSRVLNVHYHETIKDGLIKYNDLKCSFALAN